MTPLNGPSWMAVLALALGILGLAFSLWRARKRNAQRAPRISVLDHLLLWPRLLRSSKSVDRSRRLFTGRELWGWLVLAVLIVIGVVFF